MEKSKRKSGSRPKKFKFKGNQFTSPNVSRLSASGKKLDSDFGKTEWKSEFPGFEGHSLIDKRYLFTLLESCLCCRNCFSSVKIKSTVTCGIAEKITVTCSSCDVICTMNPIPEINTRFFYSLRCLGQGFRGAQTFCGLMDMPKPLTKTAYNSCVNKIVKATSVCAENSMVESASSELKLTENSDIPNAITVSGDGTWKTRGHSSLIGVCTLIGAMSGKVIDTEVLSRHCKGCESWKDIRKGVNYENWLKEHSNVCEKNHEGSAGMMEVVGMKNIFQRSKSTRQVLYANYIGDGDSKTFMSLEKDKPYGQIPISKIECVGHIQKRMGARLRKRKADLKGKKLSDGKTIGGKGRLTDAVIDQLTVYYGNAIRGNNSSVKEMQQAIWAIFYHKRSTDEEPVHDFCPKGETSWCPYQKVSGLNYRHKNSVPIAVMDEIKDIFKDLSMPSLLKRCLGGHTQNANESLNALIWKFCPKTSGSGKKIVQISVNEAVICFNEGQKGRVSIMKELGFIIGENCKHFAVEFDNARIAAAEKRAEAATLEARRAKRMSKKVLEEDLLVKEGSTYAPGEF